MHPVFFLLVFTLPVSLAVHLALGWEYLALFPFGIFVTVPILDAALGEDRRNPDRAIERELSERRSYRYIT